MRRLIIALAAVAVVLAAGALAAYVVHRLHQGADLRGSTSSEFVTTARRRRRRRRPGAVADVRLLRRPHALGAARAAAAVPARSGATRRAASSSSRRRSATAGCSSRPTRASSRRSARRRASARGSTVSHRCVAASPALGPHAHGTVYEAFLNRPPCNAQNGGHGVRRRGDRLRRRLREDPLAAHDRPVGELAAARRRPPLRRRLERRRLGVRRATTAASSGAATSRGAIKGALAYAGGRLYVGSYDGHVYCLSPGRRGHLAGRRRSRASSARRRSTRRRRRVRARVHRLDRRQGVLVRRVDREAALVALRPAATCTRRRRSGTSSSSPARTAGASTRSTPATGDVRWSFDAHGPISGSATVIGGVVYFSTLTRKRTYALDARTGQRHLDVPGRQVHARRRRRQQAVPGRLRHRLWDGAAVRYVVTGAAGFIGSQLAEALVARRARRRRHRLLHRLLRPGGEGGERARPRRAPARPRRRPARPRRLRRRLPPRRPAGRAQLRRASSRSTCAATCSRRSASSRPPRRPACASSSRPRRRCTARPRRTRRPSRAEPRPISPYGITKLACEHLARAYAAGFGLDAVRAALLHGVRAAAAAGHVLPPRVRRARARRDLRDLRDGRAVAELHRGRRRRRGDGRGDGARRRRGPSTTSAAARRRRCSRRSRILERLAGPAARRAARRRRDGRRAPHESGRVADPRRRSAGSRATTLADGLSRMWAWASGRVAAPMSFTSRAGRQTPRPSRRSTSAATGGCSRARWWLLVGRLVARRDRRLRGLARRRADASRRPRRSTSASRTRRAATSALQTLQTNPSTVKHDHPRSRRGRPTRVAGVVQGEGRRASAGGISTQTVAGSLVKNGQTPLVSITVKAAKRKTAACAANGLAQPSSRSRSPPTPTRRSPTTARPGVRASEQRDQRRSRRGRRAERRRASTDKLLARSSSCELGAAATSAATSAAAAPGDGRSRRRSVLTAAASERVTATQPPELGRRRGPDRAVLGALAALMWDRVAAGFVARAAAPDSRHARGQARRRRRSRPTTRST